jgi:hypothetical protein
MKTFRIKTELSHDCDGCEFALRYQQNHDDWGRSETITDCSFEPEIKEYKSEESACERDDVVTFDDETERKIAEAVKNEDDAVVEMIDEVVNSRCEFVDGDWDEQIRRQDIFDYIMDHYEKGEE